VAVSTTASPLVTRILDRAGVISRDTANAMLVGWATQIARTGAAPSPEDRRAAEKLAAKLPAAERRSTPPPVRTNGVAQAVEPVTKPKANSAVSDLRSRLSQPRAVDEQPEKTGAK
jgi:hypothetical protein